MKLMAASDIHGSDFYCAKMLERYYIEKPDRLILLGDLLYHGPRNDLPEGYRPKMTIESLNKIKDKILCVRGNCDAEVDQMVLDFPIMADYSIIYYGEKRIFATHGSRFNPQNPPPGIEGGILLCGHTHVPAIQKYPGFLYLNPGSVSIPKGGSVPSYMIFENNEVLIKDLDGNVTLKAAL